MWAGAAVVLCATMLVAASLQAWQSDRALYRPLARTCAAVAAACLAVGPARPPPLFLGLVLVVLLSIPWTLAVTRRLTSRADSKATKREQIGRPFNQFVGDRDSRHGIPHMRWRGLVHRLVDRPPTASSRVHRFSFRYQSTCTWPTGRGASVRV